MSWRGFFPRIRGRDEDETRTYPLDEVGIRRSGEETLEEPSPGFTVKRAVEIINDLPPDVSRESALRIVRGTLAAAGIKIEDFEAYTRTRESQLNSAIDLARDRQEDLRRRTEEVVQSLEEEIRKTREACDIGISEAEENVSHATAGLEEISRVHAFFGFPETAEEETPEPAVDERDDETQLSEAAGVDETQTMPRHDPFFDADEPPRGPSTYDTTDER